MTSQVRPPSVRGKASNPWRREENLYPAAARTWQPKVFIKTFGCQMNLRDSEVITGLLLESGFEVLDNLEREAEAVLLVTCSVRQHAEDKVWSEIGRLAKLAPKPVIGLVGCMAENYKDAAFKRMPGIDLVVGTNNIGEIPGLLKDIFRERRETKDERRLLAVNKIKRDEFVYEPAFRQEKDRCFVVISEGCDNFCSYCVVPYVRGRLRHRQPGNILKEVESCVEKGIKSITLLGQNVNAYSYKDVDFIKLLELVNPIKGLKEFAFVTSHPRDASRRLFEAMAGLDKLKKSLHLPFQSGSNRILELMKRGYTREHYLHLAGEYRKIVPEGALTTDIIVGFPGETEVDFRQTLLLIEEARFNSAYIFKYSPRGPAAASKLKDDVPKQEKERRHKILLETQKGISKELKV
ncbi:MAG TPA: tRNA (N6-isopentenyl adenosine(37)-C2)-methylthiotransferase MiaB [Candidatus Omnitrophota bacterium]|nr:tRNA (N6-isopentenyl adenosine(37)-C2)-methylthiotransferase MiaB [Candidatus Omnitrophota bacterium]